MSDFKINYLFDKLMMNDDFSKNLQKSLENIVKDGKIDQYDIPEIIFIVTSLINNTPSITFTAENLSELVKKLFEFIAREYKLVPDETQRDSFNRLIESSIKLVMLQPKIKDTVNKCCAPFFLKRA
jgi:hypothetical protein